MGAAFAGIVRTPLTSVIMIFEMTRDYSIIVPLMISNLISFFISQQLQHEPIYEALALQEGVFLPTGESREELTGVRVSEVMHQEAEPLSPTAPPDAAKARLSDEKTTSWPVGDSHKFVEGVVSLHQIETADPPPANMHELLERNGEYPFVHADHPLSYALERMGQAGVDVLPVVSRANIHEMIGLVTLPDVLTAYGVARGGAVPARQ
jgi:CIC family chloride channel protein